LIIGIIIAAVFPEPVCAVAIRSLPDPRIETAYCWIGVGFVYFIRCKFSIISGHSFMSLNVRLKQSALAQNDLPDVLSKEVTWTSTLSSKYSSKLSPVLVQLL